MSPRPILVVKTGEPPPMVKSLHGDFEDWIAAGLGSPLETLEVVDVYRDEPLPEPSAISGVVVTGSPAMVTERPRWSEAAGDWLAGLVRHDRLPILGLCYGHQLLAHALGGAVGTNPNGREMGTVEVTFTNSSDGATDSHPQVFAPLFTPGVFPGQMSHLESVLRPPPGARVLARTALDPHSVIEFGPRQWGVQFHPEFDRQILQSYVEARRDALVDEGLDPDGLIAAARETPALTRVLARFAGFVATGGGSRIPRDIALRMSDSPGEIDGGGRGE